MTGVPVVDFAFGGALALLLVSALEWGRSRKTIRGVALSPPAPPEKVPEDLHSVITIFLTGEQAESMAKLRRLAELTDNTKLVGRALYVYAKFLTEVAQGAKIILEYPSGKEAEVTL